MSSSRRRFPTEIIAHRGFSSLAPENTLAAFRLALESRADRVEFDVLLTRDGVPVVIHDALLDRTTTGRGAVASHSLLEIRSLDAGSWFSIGYSGELVPTLDEVLLLCRGQLSVNVEIKEEAVQQGAPGAESIERQVLLALERHGLVSTAVVSSFELLAVQRMRTLCPALSCELLFNGNGRLPGPRDLDAASDAGLSGLSVSREELKGSPGLVAEAHARDLRLKVYTVDDEAEMSKFLALGVDGIFTNRPDLLARLLFVE